jgi:HlyD family secretion protein
MKRFLWIAILIALVVGGVAIYLLQPGTPVDVAVAKTGTVRVYVEERAKTRLPTTYRVTMPLNGRILPIEAREGDIVSEGKIVARMDDADLKTDLAEAKSKVEQFQQLIVSMINTAKSAEAQWKSQKEKAKWADEEFRRVRSAHEKGAATDSELRAAELTKLQSAFDALKENFTVQAIAAIQKAIDVMKQDAREKVTQKQRDKDRAAIKSPVGGVVLKRHISNKQYLTAGTLLLEIGRLEELEIEADVLTQDAVRVRVGQPVEIEGAAVGPQPVAGTVAQVYPQGFEKTSSLGVEQQRVKVIIRFQNGVLESLAKQNRRLGIDYRVRVKILTDQSESALTIPRSAVFRNVDGGWQAFVVRGDVARLVELKLGLMNDLSVEVLDGVKQGDRVIVAPESSLKDGAKVQVK